jgi:hypothetical protein
MNEGETIHLAGELSEFSTSQLRHVKNLLLVARLLHRINYPDERGAHVLWKFHDAFSQGQHFGIDFREVFGGNVHATQQIVRTNV